MFNRFIRRPVLSIVISLVIVFLGVLAITQLPVTQFPTISPPKVTVVADYPGANNELMVKAIIIPLERALNGVPGMKYITADCGNDGEATVEVIFNLGTDPNTAALNVQNRVASVINKLPPLVVREGLKISQEVPNMLMYINLFSTDSATDQKFLFNFQRLIFIVGNDVHFVPTCSCSSTCVVNGRKRIYQFCFKNTQRILVDKIRCPIFLRSKRIE